jgi:hypothetical protein
VATDPDRRTAARVALLVALPVAFAVGLASLWSLGAVGRAGFRFDHRSTPDHNSRPSRPPFAGADRWQFDGNGG